MPVTYESNNIFARILRGEAPAFKVYEDDASLAFMDVMPQVDGHTLVIPKCEAEDLLDADPVILAQTIQTVQQVAAAVKAAFAAPGIMLAQLNGAAAGQTVFHLHFHIMPRHEGLALGMHAREMQDFAILEAHAERIRACLASHE
ncbi:MAG: HIT domain-containing protein [bacterium]